MLVIWKQDEKSEAVICNVSFQHILGTQACAIRWRPVTSSPPSPSFCVPSLLCLPARAGVSSHVLFRPPSSAGLTLLTRSATATHLVEVSASPRQRWPGPAAGYYCHRHPVMSEQGPSCPPHVTSVQAQAWAAVRASCLSAEQVNEQDGAGETHSRVRSARGEAKYRMRF